MFSISSSPLFLRNLLIMHMHYIKALTGFTFFLVSVVCNSHGLWAITLAMAASSVCLEKEQKPWTTPTSVLAKGAPQNMRQSGGRPFRLKNIHCVDCCVLFLCCGKNSDKRVSLPLRVWLFNSGQKKKNASQYFMLSF